MERNKIIKSVQSRLNEIANKNSIDIIPNALIESVLDDVAISFLKTAPVTLLPVSKATPTCHGNADGSGWMSIPSDYLRLIHFRLEDWVFPVTQLVVEGSLKDKLQKFKYSRGTVNRPVGVLSFNSDGDRCIRYYSALDATVTASEFLYVKNLKPEQLPDMIIYIFTWMVASVVLQQQEYIELSKVAQDRFVSLVNQYYNAT